MFLKRVARTVHAIAGGHSRVALEEETALDGRTDFDADFYRGRYSDIAEFSDEAAIRHFVRHGCVEGRFPNTAALVASLETKHGPLPDEFEPFSYRALNPDIAGLTEGWQLAEHYLLSGRRERRRFLPDQVDGFDPDHFRETHPGFAASSDAVCQEAWLRAGGKEAEPGTQIAHLARLGLALQTFPSAFPWPYYGQLYPRVAVHRWSALAHFLREGFAEVGATLPYGTGAAAFLSAVGDHFRHAGSPQALAAYELAAAAGEMSAPARERLAEAYERAGGHGPARALYAALAAEGHGPALRGLVRTADPTRTWEETFSVLAVRSQEDATQAPLLQEAAEAYFAARSRLARARYAERNRGDGDAVLAEAIARVAAFFGTQGPVAPIARGEAHTVLVLAEGGQPESARLRLETRHPLLAQLGYDVRVFGYGENAAFEAALPNAVAVILYRMPAWPSVIHAVQAARRAGVPTLYEADSLTFDPRHAPLPLSSFEGRIGARMHEETLFGAALYRGAASLCDHGLAPNLHLAEHLRATMRGRDAFVLRESRPVEEPARRGDDGEVRVFLRSMRVHALGAGSGSGAALLDALQRHPTLHLTTAGYIELDDSFTPFAARIRQLGPESDWHSALRRSDINLAIAIPGEIGECEPITNWLDAARFGVATLADTTRAYAFALLDGRDACLAGDAEAWHKRLERLIGDPGGRAQIAAAARDLARSAYGPEAALEECRGMIRALTKPTRR